MRASLGVAAVVGHTFPLYRKGGKGVAAAGGALVVLYPLIVVSLAVVWFVVARLLHKASLASLLATVLFPVLVAALRYDLWEIGVVSALALLVIVRHLGKHSPVVAAPRDRPRRASELASAPALT